MKFVWNHKEHESYRYLTEQIKFSLIFLFHLSDNIFFSQTAVVNNLKFNCIIIRYVLIIFSVFLFIDGMQSFMTLYYFLNRSSENFCIKFPFQFIKTCHIIHCLICTFQRSIEHSFLISGKNHFVSSLYNRNVFGIGFFLLCPFRIWILHYIIIKLVYCTIIIKIVKFKVKVSSLVNFP